MNAQHELDQLKSWWRKQHLSFSRGELIADGVIHTIGFALTLALGSVLIAFAVAYTAREEAPALILYVVSLLTLLGVSLAYNLWPESRAKDVLARFDQAAIFLFIAATYAPFLVLIRDSSIGVILSALVWGGAIVGMALKLTIPQRFGRIAIPLYLAIGWSGVIAIQLLADTLPTATLWLIVAGGVVYSLGLVFHLWSRLRFQNAVWHGFVVAGASLHLTAMLHCMVIDRLAMTAIGA
ncbi:PAQR family membrane homeostasis protein TrhA [Cucumibacter marinus]|uniref:PAQR family membrane homeostasis protein TrhA n=1 Tax=Cucumibacter marinus TaxID=1121252 RepID=UPI000409EF52|nr:hemolysin III family protein [Cucumibacter marinus]